MNVQGDRSAGAGAGAGAGAVDAGDPGSARDTPYSWATLAARIGYEQALLDQRFGKPGSLSAAWNLGPRLVSRAHEWATSHWKGNPEGWVTRTFKLKGGRGAAAANLEKARQKLDAIKAAIKGDTVDPTEAREIIATANLAHDCIRDFDGFADNWMEYISANGACLLAQGVVVVRNAHRAANNQDPLGPVTDFFSKYFPYLASIGVTRGENCVTEVTLELEGPDGSKMPSQAGQAIFNALDAVQNATKPLPPTLVSYQVKGGKLEVNRAQDGSFTVAYPDEQGASHKATFPDRAALLDFVSARGVVGHHHAKKSGFAQAEVEGGIVMVAGSAALNALFTRWLAKHPKGSNASAGRESNPVATLLGSGIAGFGAGALMYGEANRLMPLSINTDWLTGAIRAFVNVAARMGAEPLIERTLTWFGWIPKAQAPGASASRIYSWAMTGFAPATS